MNIDNLIWLISSIVITIFIIDKFGFYKKWKTQNDKSNEIIKKAKQELKEIENEIKRRENLKKDR